MALTVSKRVTKWWHTPEDYEEDDRPPQFQIQTLTGAQRLEVLADYNRKSGQIGHEGVLAALRYGLVDWINIENENGQPLKCKGQNIQWLPDDVITNVALAIITNSELDDDDEADAEGLDEGKK